MQLSNALDIINNMGTSKHAMGDIEVHSIELGNALFESPVFVSFNLDHV